MSSIAEARTVLEVGDDGVALISIINPPFNYLPFDDSYEGALRRDDVKAIIFIGAKGNFSGGFDIIDFGAIQGGRKAEPRPGYVSVEIITDGLEGI